MAGSNVRHGKIWNVYMHAPPDGNKDLDREAGIPALTQVDLQILAWLLMYIDYFLSSIPEVESLKQPVILEGQDGRSKSACLSARSASSL